MIKLIFNLLDKSKFNIFAKNIAFTILATLFFLPFPNKSNISIYIILPAAVLLQAKYLFGDLDDGFQWSLSDILYWISLYIFSFLTICVYKRVFPIKNNK